MMEPLPPIATFSFERFSEHLRDRLAGPLPGSAAQLRMAPAYRQDPELVSVSGKACREAAVLALFFPLEATPSILLTVRRDDLRDHAGQVSFPGGRREPDEDLHETALREAYEETGLVPDAVEVLGSLTPLYIPPSNFCVYPFVGLTTATPSLTPQDAEVETLLHAPLSHLLHPRTQRAEPWILHGRRVVVPFLDVEGYKVWGATAMMLAELLALLTEH